MAIRTKKQFIGWSLVVVGAAGLVKWAANFFLDAKVISALMRHNGIAPTSAGNLLREYLINPWAYVYLAIIVSGILVVVRDKRQND